MFTPDMLAAAQKMMENMSPEQMSQIAGMASKMNPDMLKNLSGGNAGLPMPSGEQFEEAKEKLKNMNSDDLKGMFETASARMTGQKNYMLSGATALKNEGNDLVRAGDYEGGVAKFDRALENLSSFPISDPSVITLTQSIKLNMALCYLKLSKFTECISTCDGVLSQDARNIKALYRRGVAKRESGALLAGAIDLKLSMLLAEQKDEIINNEFEKTLRLVVVPDDLETIDSTSLDILSIEQVAEEADPSVHQDASSAAPLSSPVEEVSSASSAVPNLAKAKEIIEANPDVIDKMGDVFSQMDDGQLDGLLSMSAAGADLGGMGDLSEMKKILKNKDFMKSMTEMMKNMDPSALQGLMGQQQAAAAGRVGAKQPQASTSSGKSSAETVPSQSSTEGMAGGMPDMSKLMSDPSMLKSMESMIDAIPDSMMEEMLTTQAGVSNIPSFVTGARMKWVVKRVMAIVRFWIFLKRVIAVILTRNGKIVLAVLVLLFGMYHQYKYLLGKPTEQKGDEQ